ncbi:MAG: hypothetical protein VSS75_029875 [Candidatus Parabeggiatoa sp.]|nr:hypothetical protein [Candidatus Parabeggiatoa sp.]
MNDIKSKTCQELVIKIEYELNQKSAIVVTLLEILLDEDNELYGFANDKQKELLLHLREEAKIIRILSEELGIWLVEQQA